MPARPNVLEGFTANTFGDESIIPIVLAASSCIPVLVASAAATATAAGAGRTFAVMGATTSSVVERTALLRRRSCVSVGASATAATAAAEPAAAKPTAATAAAKPTAAWSFFTRGTFAFGMSKVDDEASTTNIDTAQSFDGTFGRFSAGHRDKPEAAFATVGVHGQVNANDRTRAC